MPDSDKKRLKDNILSTSVPNMQRVNMGEGLAGNFAYVAGSIQPLGGKGVNVAATVLPCAWPSVAPWTGRYKEQLRGRGKKRSADAYDAAVLQRALHANGANSS